MSSLQVNLFHCFLSTLEGFLSFLLRRTDINLHWATGLGLRTRAPCLRSGLPTACGLSRGVSAGAPDQAGETPASLAAPSPTRRVCETLFLHLVGR